MIQAYLFIFVLIIVSLLIFKFLQQERYKNLPPSPPSLPIIGHLHRLKGSLPHETFLALSKIYGPIVLLRFGSRRVIVISSPSAVEECFTKNDIIFAHRPKGLAGKLLSYNYTVMLSASYSPLWHNLRRITNLEIFSNISLATTTEIRQTEVNLMLRQIMRSYVNGDSKVDLNSKFVELTMNNISMMIMGNRYYGEDVKDREAVLHFHGMLTEFLELVQTKNTGQLLPFLEWMDLQGLKRRMKALMKKLDKFLQNIVDEHRRNLSNMNGNDGSQGPERLTLVDRLLTLQEVEPDFYTEDIIKGLMQVILIAGTEASYTTMEWGMSLLLNHPNAMEKVRSEIDIHVGHKRLLEEQDLPKLSYLQNVINETLRLFPPVPLLVPHVASDDCTIGGYNVPKGTTLLPNAWAIQRDPKLWVSPEKFIPERFEGMGTGDHNFMWIPFGTGRRGCPGAGLANRMVGLALGSLVQSFEWETIGVEVDMVASSGFILTKSKPLRAICNPRIAMAQHFR